MSDLKTFGMMIPSCVVSLDIEPDPNGVPVYAECPAQGDLCACTGACRKILSYNTDPDKVRKYHAGIEQRNKLWKDRLWLERCKWTDLKNKSITP